VAEPKNVEPSRPLFSRKRVNPSHDALTLLGGLELMVEKVDELLMAADYKPLVLLASLR
jgi:hypothetical protein